MTATDVTDELMGLYGADRLLQDDQRAAVAAWVSLVETMKPDAAFMPFAPDEVARAKAILLRLLECLNTAHAKNRAPMSPVEPGGR